MSRFSGKCDFYDGFVAIGCDGDEEKVKEKIKRLKLYVQGRDGREHLVKTETIKDIAKYYPYLEAIMTGDSEGNTTIILGCDSFIDQEERDRLNFNLDYMLKCWRRCKRKKIPPEKIKDEVANTLHMFGKDEVLLELLDRVEKDGEKASIDGLHLPFHEYFRKEWFKELVSLGYTEYEAFRWVYKAFFFSEEEMNKRLNTEL